MLSEVRTSEAQFSGVEASLYYFREGRDSSTAYLFRERNKYFAQNDKGLGLILRCKPAQNLMNIAVYSRALTLF